MLISIGVHAYMHKYICRIFMGQQILVALYFVTSIQRGVAIMVATY